MLPLHAGSPIALAGLLLAGGLAAAFGAYLAAARSLRGSRRPWPAARTIAFAAALCALASAALAPVALQHRPFTGHAVQHVLLGMAAPVLLALAAPITLAMRAVPAARRPLARILHLRILRALVHPLVAASIGVGGLSLLYLTPLYALTERHAALHGLVHLHVFVAGCLFAWAIVGTDPMPGRPALTVRAGALVVAAAGHAVLAKLMYANGPVGEGVVPELADWRAGAQVMFYAGDLVEGLLLALLMLFWYRRRGAARAALTASASA